MPEHLGLWKYCDKEQCKDMLLSFRLVGSDSWTDGKIIACLYALSNHAKEHYHKTELPKKQRVSEALFGFDKAEPYV